MFTFGFDGSNQDLASQLAQYSGGNYFLVADSTIDLATQYIWDELTGLQLIGDTSVFASGPSYNFV